MGNISQKSLAIIESHWDTSTTPLEVKIRNEYYFLKKRINLKSENTRSSSVHIDKDLKQEILHKLTINYSLSTKSMIYQINFKKRILRFDKWFKMVYPNWEINPPGSPWKQNTSKPMLWYNTIDMRKSMPRTSNMKWSPNSNNNSNTSTLQIQKQIAHTDNYPNHKSKILCENNVFSWYDYNNKIESGIRNFYVWNKVSLINKINKGPPDSLRWLSWMVIWNIPETRNEKVYYSYLSEDIDETIDTQIKKDLNRTLNDFIFPSEEEEWCDDNSNWESTFRNDISREAKQKSWYNVLRVMSSIDKELGYCQGINFITSFLLSLSDYNEVDTFYFLVSWFSKNFDTNFNLRGFFINNFPVLECFLYIFDHVFERELPNLYKHIKSWEIPHEAWIGKWIQTWYTIAIPQELNYRLWDCLLSKGLFFLISFSISLISFLVKDLLAVKDAFDLSEYFKNFFNISYTNLSLYKRCNFNQTAFQKETWTGSDTHIELEDIISKSLKLHKHWLAKNIFTTVKDDYYKIKGSIHSYAILYDLSYRSLQFSQCSSNKEGKTSKEENAKFNSILSQFKFGNHLVTNYNDDVSATTYTSATIKRGNKIHLSTGAHDWKYKITSNNVQRDTSVFNFLNSHFDNYDEEIGDDFWNNCSDSIEENVDKSEIKNKINYCGIGSKLPGQCVFSEKGKSNKK